MLAKCRVSERDLILVPGNHDISRKTVENNKLLYDGIRANLLDQNYIEYLYTENKINSYATNISKGFFELAELIGRSWGNPIYQVSSVANFTIVALNSAFSCSLEGSSKDHGRLIFPSSAWEDAIRFVSDLNVLITSMHHPLGHLTEASGRVLGNKITKYSRAHLFGHLHAADPTLAATPRGDTLFLQSGALYADGDNFKGYCLLTIDETGLYRRVQYRTYQEARGEFDEGINVAPHGIFFPSKEDDDFWNKKRRAYSDAEFETWLMTPALKIVERELDKTFTDRRLSDTYVFPPLSQNKITTDDSLETAFEDKGKTWDYGRVVSASENLAIMIPDEFGATSILSYIAIQQCRSPKDFQFNRIPLYIDLRSTKPYNIVRALRQAHPAPDHPVFGWNE